MTTTTQATSTTILNIENIDWGGCETNFDLDAIRSEYRDAIQALLPEGVTLAMDGMVFAEVDEGDGPKYANPLVAARSIDWSDFEAGGDQDVDFWAIADRHAS